MPDISMCANEACPSKSLCYRHEAKPNEWRQAYAMFRTDESGRCDDFTPLSQSQRQAAERSHVNTAPSVNAEGTLASSERNQQEGVFGVSDTRKGLA